MNAGLRLWAAQKAAGTGLCVGADPHYDEAAGLGAEFYFAVEERSRGTEVHAEVSEKLRGALGLYIDPSYQVKGRVADVDRAMRFLIGVAVYFLEVITVAWAAGIRVFKPQVAFYEQFSPAGELILEMVTERIHWCGAKSGEAYFIILDAKRGDIDSTQRPYYRSYLTDRDEETFPGGNGRYGFDTMTVTTWMGEDVLTPGLPWFKKAVNSKGAIVVTRSSNPSGTTFQDCEVREGLRVVLSEKQEPFRLTNLGLAEITSILGRAPSAHEVMLWETERFCKLHKLHEDGVPSIFSVMGSTVVMVDSFRKLRPNGVALVPGFGAQGGSFANAMPLVLREGPMKGHLGVLASSRDHNFPWMTKAGGSGDPKNLENDLKFAIEKFRGAERLAYHEAGVDWPF